MKVDKTTVYREIKRNSKKQGSYNPDFAQELYSERKDRFANNRKFTPSIENYVRNKIVDTLPDILFGSIPPLFMI